MKTPRHGVPRLEFSNQRPPVEYETPAISPPVCIFIYNQVHNGIYRSATAMDIDGSGDTGSEETLQPYPFQAGNA